MANIGGAPSVENCLFAGNRGDGVGGAMVNIWSAPRIGNCAFEGNHSNQYGGAIANVEAEPLIEDCVFDKNMGYRGGGAIAIANGNSNAQIARCRFTGNRTYYYGGGIFNHLGSPLIADSVFLNNRAYFMQCVDTYCTIIVEFGDGGGMYNLGSSPFVHACVFYGNTSATWSQAMLNTGGGSPIIENSVVMGAIHNHGGSSTQIANSTLLYVGNEDASLVILNSA